MTVVACIVIFLVAASWVTGCVMAFRQVEKHPEELEALYANEED